MKRSLFILILTPVISWAGVSNFNEIIAENSQVQREIHKTMKLNDESMTTAFSPRNDRKVVLDSVSYNAPTNARHLRFKKEVSEQRVSGKKEMNRLAKEFKSMDQEL